MDVTLTVLLPIALAAAARWLPGPWQRYSLALLLPAYAALEGVRLRRPALSAALAAAVTLGFITLSTLRFGPGLRLHWPHDSVWFALPVSGGIGALALLSALVSRALARPQLASLIERRAHVLMAPEAFADLGFRDDLTTRRGDRASTPWAPPAADNEAADSDSWLDPVRRRQGVDKVVGRAVRLDLPRLGVTAAEIRSGQALRVFCDRACPICHGSGRAPCPVCGGGAHEAPADLNAETPSTTVCERCGGQGWAACECADAVQFRIPATAHAGFIVRGQCGRPGHRHYATVHSAALKRVRRPWPVGLAGALGLPAGLASTAAGTALAVEQPDFRVAAALVACGSLLWAIAAVPTLRGSSKGWAIMRAALVALILGVVVTATATPLGLLGWLRRGLPLAGLGLLALWAAGLLGLAALLRYWHLAPVRAFLGDHGLSTQALAPTLAPARDRLTEAVAWRPLRRTAGVFAALLIAWVVSDGAAGYHWTFLRAGIAERSGGETHAVQLYQRAGGQARSPTQSTRAVQAGNRAQLTALEKALGFSRGAGLSGARRAQIVRLCSGLAGNEASLDSDQRERAASLMVACADTLVETKHWEPARRVLRSLVTAFGESRAAREVSDRSEWRFASLGEMLQDERVALGPHLVADSGGFGFRVEHSYRDAAPGHVLLTVAMKLAHIGRTEKELLASSFGLFTDNASALHAAGLREDAEALGYDVHYLLQSTTYDGISVGPDLVDVRVVFEVPNTGEPLSLSLNGERVATVYPF